MRLICKGSEPSVLASYRKTGERYNSLTGEAKSEIRDALVREQYGLCCFCTQRIQANPTQGIRMKIAHWLPQSVDANQDLVWNNLMGACPGNEGAPLEDQHCDTRQGNAVLTISPLEPSHIATISYTTRGEVRSTRADLNHDLGVTLNLNEPVLRANRREAVLSMTNTLGRRQGEVFSTAAMAKALARCRTPDARGNLPPFAGALEARLQRRIGA